jgi:hypothetical protein
MNRIGFIGATPICQNWQESIAGKSVAGQTYLNCNPQLASFPGDKSKIKNARTKSRGSAGILNIGFPICRDKSCHGKLGRDARVTPLSRRCAARTAQRAIPTSDIVQLPAGHFIL